MEGEETVKQRDGSSESTTPGASAVYLVTETTIIGSDNLDGNVALHTDNYPKALKLSFDT